jgi:gas vesicle protein
MDKRVKKFAIGTVVAAAAGYIAGILTAPKSGKETREDLKDTAVRTYSAAEKQLKALHTELNQLLDQGRSKAGELKGTGLV